MPKPGDIVDINDLASPYKGKRGIVIDVNKRAVLVRLYVMKGTDLTQRDKPFMDSDVTVRAGEVVSIIYEK